MDKRIEDYLHLYLGQECYYKNEIAVIKGVSDNRFIKLKSHSRGLLNVIWNDKIKIMLRPLSDISSKEQAEADRVHDLDNTRSPMEAQLPFYLLSKGFDLFGLIPAGLAIDKTKLKDNG